MPEDARIWEIVEGDNLREIKRVKLNREERIENWLEKDISILSNELLIIGRQVETGFGGIIDLLCLDSTGDTIIVELKRDKTPREITAQTIDYASWVKDLSNDKITEIADKYLGDKEPLEEVFKKKFGIELPETLNEEHNMLIVASEIDASSERIINYLSDTYGVGINVATFQYFRDSEKEFLARVFLIEPSEVKYKTKIRASSKRKPNLSYEELEEIAVSNGVGELYQQLIEGVANFFDDRTTTRSSISFVGKLGESRKALFNLIPKDSSPDEGLKFQVYINRLSDYLNIDKKEIILLLPKSKKEWEYQKSDSIEWSGYEGFFKNLNEVVVFLKGLGIVG